MKRWCIGLLAALLCAALGLAVFAAGYAGFARRHRELRRLRLKSPIPTRKVCFLKQRRQYLSTAAKELERMVLAAADCSE